MLLLILWHEKSKLRDLTLRSQVKRFHNDLGYNHGWASEFPGNNNTDLI